MVFVIPYFIPHQGCPHQCLFCNQNSITGETFSTADIHADINRVIKDWLTFRKERKPTHFAFYGGSFTCLPMDQQSRMLEAISPWVKKGEIDKLRLSTRPDCISPEVCELLKRYNVGVVELGVQSLDNKVLLASRRGHDSKDACIATELLKENGFQVGIQLMPGLPAETRASFMRTVKKAITLQPSFVRIYPVVVVERSGLAELYESGEYTPLSLEMAVVPSAWAMRRFQENDIEVVRTGLQPSHSLEKSVIAGPYHAAFGEMVKARQWFRRVRKILAENGNEKIRFIISARDLSCFNGVNRTNRKKYARLGLEERMEVVVNKSMQKGSLDYAVC